MAHQFTTSYIEESRAIFRQYKAWSDRAIAQVPDELLTREISPESNSIATIVKHMAGNMRSRWTDFLTTDGEKPDRHRDTEFETPPQTRDELVTMWEQGWSILFATLDSLTEADLARTIYIRTEPHSVMQAINRQVAHYALHVGQIVFLSRYLAGSEWKTLTVPKGKSAEFTAQVAKGETSQR